MTQTAEPRPPRTGRSPWESIRQVDAQRWATWAHVATLAASAAFLLRTDRAMWFLLDEWAFIVDRRLVGGPGTIGIWEPHNEHWSSVAALSYRFLVDTVGLHSYLPYLAIMIAAHLVAAHLLWRVICRVVPDRWVATGVVTVFLFLGAGWENLTRAFQMTLLGSFAAGLGWLLLVPSSRRFERRDLLGWVLGVLSLAFSGVGLTMVGVVVLYSLLRRGWRMALVTASVPAVVYLVWLAAYGRSGLEAGGQPLGQGLRDLPGFVWHGLTGAIDLASGLTGLGVVVVVVLGAWSLRRGRPRDATWALALSCAAGAAGLLASTAIRRSQLGVELAIQSRYVYLVVALLLPLICLALDHALPRERLRLAVAVGTAALLLVQVPVLRDHAREWAGLSQQGRGVFVAAVELVQAGEPVVATTPLPWFAPEVQVEELVTLVDEGTLPLDVVPTPEEVLTAQTYLQLVGTAVPQGWVPPDRGSSASPRLAASVGTTWSPAAPGCLLFAPGEDGALAQLHPGGPAELLVSVDDVGTVGARYVAPDGSAAALRDQTFDLGPDHGLRLTSVAAGPDLRLTLPAGGATVCGLATPDA